MEVCAEEKPQSPTNSTHEEKGSSDPENPAPELSNTNGGGKSEHKLSGHEVRDVLQAIASSGKFWHEWDDLKSMLSFQLKQVLSEYPEAKVGDDPAKSTIREAFSNLVNRLDEALQCFIDGPPFTLQRFCEILLDARGIYPVLSKLELALEKNLLVTTTLPRSTDAHPKLQPSSPQAVPEVGSSDHIKSPHMEPEENGDQDSSPGIKDEIMIEAVESEAEHDTAMDTDITEDIRSEIDTATAPPIDAVAATSPPTDAVAVATSLPTDAVAAATSPPTDAVDAATSHPNDAVTTATSPPNDAVTAATTAATSPPKDAVAAATSPPNDAVTAATSPPNDAVAAATSPPNDAVAAPAAASPSGDAVAAASPLNDAVVAAASPPTDVVSAAPPTDAATVPPTNAPATAAPPTDAVTAASLTDAATAAPTDSAAVTATPTNAAAVTAPLTNATAAPSAMDTNAAEVAPTTTEQNQ